MKHARRPTFDDLAGVLLKGPRTDARRLSVEQIIALTINGMIPTQFWERGVSEDSDVVKQIKKQIEKGGFDIVPKKEG